MTPVTRIAEALLGCRTVLDPNDTCGGLVQQLDGTKVTVNKQAERYGLHHRVKHVVLHVTAYTDDYVKYDAESIDAVVITPTCNTRWDEVLCVLRPGGRIILVPSEGMDLKHLTKQLRLAGVLLAVAVPDIAVLMTPVTGELFVAQLKNIDMRSALGSREAG